MHPDSREWIGPSKRKALDPLASDGGDPPPSSSSSGSRSSKRSRSSSSPWTAALSEVSALSSSWFGCPSEEVFEMEKLLKKGRGSSLFASPPPFALRSSHLLLSLPLLHQIPPRPTLSMRTSKSSPRSPPSLLQTSINLIFAKSSPSPPISSPPSPSSLSFFFSNPIAWNLTRKISLARSETF